MSRAWNIEKLWPGPRQDSNLYELSNTCRALYPLDLRRTHGQRGHMLGSHLEHVIMVIVP